MLAFLIVGLLLSAVQNIQTHSSLSEIAEIPQPTANPLRWARQHSWDEMLPFERLNPRFWLGPEYRQAFRQIAPKADDFISGPNAMDRTDTGGPSRERIEIASSDEQSNKEKRESYLSMCHFKLCNLGRKRRISQGGQIDLISSVLKTKK